MHHQNPYAILARMEYRAKAATSRPQPATQVSETRSTSPPRVTETAELRMRGSPDSTATEPTKTSSRTSSLWNFFLPAHCRHTKFILDSRARKEQRRARHLSLGPQGGGDTDSGSFDSEGRQDSSISALRLGAIELENDEDEERVLIEDVQQDVLDGIIARYREEAAVIEHASVWDGKSLTVTDQQVRNVMLFFIRQMYARLRRDFTQLFPNGITGTTLSMNDVASCVAAMLIIDMAIVDDDIHSFAFTVLPNQRVSLENCPVSKRYLYHMFMALKSTAPIFKASVGAFRTCVVQHFFDPDAPVPQQFALPLHALKNALMVITVNSTFVEELRAFYRVAQTIEDEMRGAAGCEHDMTISVPFQKCNEIGRGANGVVYSCINAATGQFMALKQLKLGSAAQEQAVRAEINMLRRLRHPHIIRYLGCAFDREHGTASILMEFASRSLRSIIDECGGLTQSLTVSCGCKILEGLAYLHDQHIVHQDLKAANILITEQGHMKISDFGTAAFRDPGDELDRPRYLKGTACFIAPELVHGCAPSEASDIWAFGGILIEMISGLFPWWEVTQDHPDISVEALCYHIGTSKVPPQVPAQVVVDPKLEAVLNACVQLDPCARPTARQALAMLQDIQRDHSASGSTSTPLQSEAPGSPFRSSLVRGEVGSMWAGDFETDGDGDPAAASVSDHSPLVIEPAVQTTLPTETGDDDDGPATQPPTLRGSVNSRQV